MSAPPDRLAAVAGIEPEYWDALGQHHVLTAETAEPILRALGALGPTLGPGPEPGPSAGPNARCYIPESLASGRRIWGISIQLYSLRSARNWGIGDFTDLAAFAGIAARIGASVVGINPLHARHLACPGRASPYSPSSRIFVDAMSIDVEAMPDFAESAECAALVSGPEFRNALERARASPLVEHETVSALKLPAFERAFASFEALHAGKSDSRRSDFDRFVAGRGDALARYAEFEAIRLDRARRGLPVLEWQSWPAEWRDPESATLGAFRDEHASDIRFVEYLQWEAARQLDAAATAAREAGLALTFYRDLAVGAAKDSAEAWGDQALTASAISIGAPPDQFSVDGQNWGLPPWNPRVLSARDYAPFAELLGANMAAAGALRIDHVMALARLFWIPEGMPGSKGAYVRQPFAALAGVVARESALRHCIVIGEDLGSVPDGLRERLHDLGFLSYRVFLFERHWQGDGTFKRPHEYPAQALAMVMTHDLPTIADYWTFGDIARRAKLGLFPDEAARQWAISTRHDERWKILAVMSDSGVPPADPENVQQITEALHTLIARTPSMLAIVQLDDVLGETEPANIPGTDRQYPNWRRKMKLTLDEIAVDPRLAQLESLMRDAGRESLPPA